MTRFAGIGLLAFGLLVAFLQGAEDPAPDKPDAPVRLKKKDKAGAPEGAVPQLEQPGPDGQTKELLARVAKNMGSSEDRLKNQDPGDKTRQIQADIVKDLDELIKKAQQQEQQQSSSSGSSSSSQGGSRSQASRSQSSKQARDKGSQPKENDAAQKKDAGQGKKDQAASVGKKQDQPNQGKEASASNNGGGGNSSGHKKSTVADLFRDVWGHLPETKRQEMDAYARERFMPKYDELLRQYYRTISEQGRKKDGD
jgi:hypothetical protein